MSAAYAAVMGTICTGPFKRADRKRENRFAIARPAGIRGDGRTRGRGLASFRPAAARTYVVAMEQLAREDIAATAAVRRDLGRDYDDVLAEGLVERIGAEIDRRVDDRLAASGGRPRKRRRASEPGQPARSSGPSWDVIILALGSMLIGGITAGTILNSNGNAATAALIWLVILVINIAYARRR
jgi:hypothetical protein